MKKTTKPVIFIIMVLINILFFYLCGYGSVTQPDTASYLDPFLGAIAVAVLAFGETRLILQLYFAGRYKSLKCRRFDKKFWGQCIVFTAYYVGSLSYLSAAIYDFSVSYLSIFAMILCPLWMTGSRTLWTGERGEESYYLDDFGTWYLVSDVTENDDVVEITCAAPGERSQIISIAKKKQKLDQ